MKFPSTNKKEKSTCINVIWTVMTKTKILPLRKIDIRRSAVTALVVLLGLLIECFNDLILFPRLEYYDYYFSLNVIRVGLLAVTLSAVIFLRGSWLLFGYMTFNLISIIFNTAFLLDTSIYWDVVQFRESIFAPAYRAYEIALLVFNGGGLGLAIYLYFNRNSRRAGGVVTGVSRSNKGTL